MSALSDENDHQDSALTASTTASLPSKDQKLTGADSSNKTNTTADIEQAKAKQNETAVAQAELSDEVSKAISKRVWCVIAYSRHIRKVL
jgi:hypothetical protein